MNREKLQDLERLELVPIRSILTTINFKKISREPTFYFMEIVRQTGGRMESGLIET